MVQNPMIYKETRKADCPPKAEVTSSNLVGCANRINGLSNKWKKRQSDNPPKKSPHGPRALDVRI